MSNKEIILNEFIKSELKIKSIEKLEKYVDFCVNNNLNSRTQGETAHHHILPASKNMPFIQFSNIKENVWNGTHLTYANHYYAHWLLYDSIDHMSVVFSFCAMHYKDFTLKRITEEDLLPPEIVQECMENRSAHHKEWLNILGNDGLTNLQRKVKNTVLSEETLKKMSNRMSGKNNIVYLPGVVDKILKTKQETILDGKNMHTIGSERAARTMIENGTYIRSAEKHKETLKTEIEFEDVKMSLNKKYGIERSRRTSINGKKYLIKDIFNDDLCIPAYASQVRKVSAALETLTKNNYLGHKLNAVAKLINKEYLIGLYTEEITDSDDNEYNFILNYKEIIAKIQNKLYIFVPEMYEIKSVFDDDFIMILPLVKVRKINGDLDKRTEKIYLYKYQNDKQNRGLYTNKIIPSHIEINKTFKKI